MCADHNVQMPGGTGSFALRAGGDICLAPPTRPSTWSRAFASGSAPF